MPMWSDPFPTSAWKLYKLSPPSGKGEGSALQIPERTCTWRDLTLQLKIPKRIAGLARHEPIKVFHTRLRPTCLTLFRGSQGPCFRFGRHHEWGQEKFQLERFDWLAISNISINIKSYLRHYRLSHNIKQEKSRRYIQVTFSWRSTVLVS